MPNAKVTVTFDDSDPVEVEIKPRDLAGAEAAGTDFTKCGPTIALYAGALAALGRLKRAGSIDIDPPDSVAAFIDVADVEMVEGDDPKDE